MKVLLPGYTANRDDGETDDSGAVSIATPALSSGTVPTTVPPEIKVTLPVGTAPVAEVTAASMLRNLVPRF